MEPSADLVTVGRIGRVYGVHGWLTIHSYTEPRAQLFAYQPWLVGHDETWEALPLAGIQQTTRHDLVQFVGYDTPERSRSLTGRWLAIARQQLPVLAEGEYYWHDLIGLEVVTPAGETLGIVRDVFSTGAHPILSIDGERTHLVPFVQSEIVTHVDLPKRKLVAKWDPNF